VNAETGAQPGSGAGTAQTYSFTFGHYLQKDDWTDTRVLTWDVLATILTSHTVGSKKGSCIVPAVFSGTCRKKAEAQRIDVAFLDCDIGTTLDEIRDAVAAQGWAAIIIDPALIVLTTRRSGTAGAGRWSGSDEAASRGYACG
jgi:hypothetical protein